jgi:type IX secretion system substrate protein
MGLAGWPAGTTMLGIAGEWNDIVELSEVYYVIEYDNESQSNNETTQKPLIQMYPNPTNHTLTVIGDEIQNVEIYDVKGRRLGSYKKLNIDISKFPQGIYMVKVKTKSESVTKKIVIK